MRITRDQQLQLQEIIKITSLPISAFEVTSNDAEAIGFKFKANFFSFRINLQKNGDYYSSVFPISNKRGFNVTDTWEGTKDRFGDWIKEIEKDVLIQLDWEREDDGSPHSVEDKPVKQRVEEMIIDGNLKVALDLLQQHFEENQGSNELIFTAILKKSELNEIEKMTLMGNLLVKETLAKKANLKRAILELASKLVES